jgi:hypothetical protein
MSNMQSSRPRHRRTGPGTGTGTARAGTAGRSESARPVAASGSGTGRPVRVRALGTVRRARDGCRGRVGPRRSREGGTCGQSDADDGEDEQPYPAARSCGGSWDVGTSRQRSPTPRGVGPGERMCERGGDLVTGAVAVLLQGGVGGAVAGVSAVSGAGRTRSPGAEKSRTKRYRFGPCFRHRAVTAQFRSPV